MTSYHTTNLIAMHVGQFIRLRDYCINTTIFRFAYGEFQPCFTPDNDPNSDYAIFQAIIGRLETMYKHRVFVEGSFICYDNQRIPPVTKSVSWVDM